MDIAGIGCKHRLDTSAVQSFNTILPTSMSSKRIWVFSNFEKVVETFKPERLVGSSKMGPFARELPFLFARPRSEMKVSFVQP